MIDDGWIGNPIAATAFCAFHRHEVWRPDPGFFYKIGAGPMFDMGPYYLTALVSTLGPIKRVSGHVKISIPERVITSEPKFGQKIKVDIPTRISGSLEFENGVIATMMMSFDV